MKIVPQNFSEINFRVLNQQLWFWVGFGLFLFGVGKFFDQEVFSFIETFLRSEELNKGVVFLTEHFIWTILLLFAFVTGYRIWTSPTHQSKLLPALFAVVTTGIIAFTLKSLFDIPRPFLTLGLEPLVNAPSSSFPSVHTAVAFALFIPFFRISKIIGLLWLCFALMIGFARVYENVHYPSDIAGGIFLGGIIGTYFSHSDVKKILSILWGELEFRRQSFHFVAGFLVVFAHWAGFLRLRFIALFLGLGLLISFLSQHKKLPFIHDLLRLFDRPRDAEFPGRGAFFFLLGVFLSFALFPVKIAYAAILILSVGDSLNHILANNAPGHLRFPWNKRKNCLGVTIGIISGTVAAQFFVPLAPAFLASTVTIMGETIPWRFGKFYIDDNVLVPLIAGGIMWALV